MRYPIAAAMIAAVTFGAANANEIRFERTIASGHSAALTFGTLDDARDPTGVDVPLGIFVRIENTISDDFDDLEDRILTSAFFNIDGSPDLFGDFITGISAFGGATVGGNEFEAVGDYWAFRDDLGDREGDSLPGGFEDARYGFGADSYDGLFLNSDLINGEEETPDISGLDGGILSETGDAPEDQIERNGGETFPLYRQFVQFQIFLDDSFFEQFGIEDFGDVSWQFGDFDSGVTIPAAPIPLPTGAAMGLAGLGIIATRRRR